MFESGGEGLAGSTCVQIPGRVPGPPRALAPPTPLPCRRTPAYGLDCPGPRTLTPPTACPRQAAVGLLRPRSKPRTRLLVCQGRHSQPPWTRRLNRDVSRNGVQDRGGSRIGFGGLLLGLHAAPSYCVLTWPFSVRGRDTRLQCLSLFSYGHHSRWMKAPLVTASNLPGSSAALSSCAGTWGAGSDPCVSREHGSAQKAWRSVGDVRRL